MKLFALRKVVLKKKKSIGILWEDNNARQRDELSLLEDGGKKKKYQTTGS